MNYSVLFPSTPNNANIPDFVQRLSFWDISDTEIIMDGNGQNPERGEDDLREIFLYNNPSASYVNHEEFEPEEDSGNYTVFMSDGLGDSDSIQNLNAKEGDRVIIRDAYVGFPNRDDSLINHSEGGDGDPMFMEIQQAFDIFINSLPANSRTRISADGKIQTNDPQIRAKFSSFQQQLRRIKDVDLSIVVGADTIRTHPFFRELQASQFSIRRIQDLRGIRRDSVDSIDIEIGTVVEIETRDNRLGERLVELRSSLGQGTIPSQRFTNFERALQSSAFSHSALGVAPGLEASVLNNRAPFMGF